jgi:hypothetical protein
MGLVAWIRRFWSGRSTPRHDYVESSLTFPELDLDRMSKRMRLGEEGASRGAANQPSSHSDTYDDVENRVVTAIESEFNEGHERLLRMLRAYDTRLSSLSVGTLLSELSATGRSVGTDLRAAVRNGHDTLFRLRRQLLEITAEAMRFRADNGIERPARYPDSRVFRVGVLVVLVLLEMCVNGVLLAKGNWFGLLGGGLTALAIAFGNVGLGAVAGRVVAPNLLHRAMWRRALGAVGLISFASFSLAYNLGVAHYRSALGGPLAEQAETVALQTLRAAPFGVPEVLGWLLFGLGLSFALIAAADAFGMDDPYPGYGHLARRENDAIAAYVEEKNGLTEDLRDLRDEAVKRLQAASTEVELRERQRRTIAEQRARVVQQFRRYSGYLEQCANDLLSGYRTANTRARSTPAPAHFETRWQLHPYAEPPGGPGDGDDPAFSERVRQAFTQLAGVRQQIEEEYAEALSEYEKIEELSQEVKGNAPVSPASA